VAGLAVGPAVVAALPRLRALPGRLGFPVVGGLVAVLVADASGMSRGEVERIWLPLWPWLLVGAVVLARGGGVPRGWLAAQAACTLVITALVRTSW
jgi:methylthioxylose transferase